MPPTALPARHAQGLARLAITATTRTTDRSIVAQHLPLAFRRLCPRIGEAARIRLGCRGCSLGGHSHPKSIARTSCVCSGHSRLDLHRLLHGKGRAQHCCTEQSGLARMGTVTVEHDGYTANGDFQLASAKQITWSASVYKGGRFCGFVQGIINHGDHTIPDGAVRESIRNAISNGAGLNL